MAPSKREQVHHAMAIPLPIQGHINPLMRFCERLASQEGFTITFVDIQLSVKNAKHQQKQELDSTNANGIQLQAHSSTDAAHIPSVALPLRPPPAAAARGKLGIRRAHIPLEIAKPGAGFSLLASFTAALPSLAPPLEALLSQLLHEEPPITCLISDVYMTDPTQAVAAKFHVPRIAFHTSSHTSLLFTHYINQGALSLDDVLKAVARKEGSKEDIFVDQLPGLPRLRNGDLMDFHDDNVCQYELKLRTYDETKGGAHAFVVNSFEELEGNALHINIGLPTFAVGPLSKPLNEETSTSLFKENKDCMVWLNEQPCLSVLYVSFGSVASLSGPQFEEIVAGLISSQQRFLFVFRPNLVKDVDYSTFPSELLSKSHGKCYSIAWAPQVSVLSHRSIGGFLTHCGWNSTIEAMSLGVPMLCFPHMADQFINAKFVIGEWKVGLGFKINKESGLVERDEVKRVIETLMVGEEGKVLQRNANYFKEIFFEKLQLEGTLTKSVQALVHSLG